MFRTLYRAPGRGLQLLPLRQQRCQAKLSTAVANPESIESSFFKTSETNPNNLSDRHAGRFYSISDEIFKKLYDHSRHHGFPVTFRELCTTLREQCILVRKPYLDLKHCVDSLDLRKPVVRFGLYGQEGTGKSITLTSMVHYAYVNEFIIVHFPWVPLWGKYCREIVHSTIRQGYFDHTIDAVTWLTKFKTQNTELIQKLNLVTEKDYQWTKREVTPVGSSLLEIVEHGISRPAHASECMTVLFQELKQQSTKQKCKTMVLFDGVNALFYECELLRNPTNKKAVIPQDKITAFLAMKDLLRTDWSGGVILTLIDQMAITDKHRESHLPRYLLGKEGWETLDPFVPIEVPNYTSQEVQTTIDYLLDRKWLAHPKAGTEEGRLEIEYVSTRNPLNLAVLCNSR